MTAQTELCGSSLHITEHTVDVAGTKRLAEAFPVILSARLTVRKSFRLFVKSRVTFSLFPFLYGRSYLLTVGESVGNVREDGHCVILSQYLFVMALAFILLLIILWLSFQSTLDSGNKAETRFGA